MLYGKELPKSGSFGMGDKLSERTEILKIMLRQTDAEILALAEEMGVPLEKNADGTLKNKSAAIQYLIKGGCPNCGKAKV